MIDKSLRINLDDFFFLEEYDRKAFINMKNFAKKFISLIMLSQLVVLSGCFQTNKQVKKVENKFEDKHILFKGFSKSANTLTLKLRSCYDVELLQFECSLYDDEGFYLDNLHEVHTLSAKKDNDFEVTCKSSINTRVNTVRFRLIQGKTYDTVDLNYTIKNKVYYYDYFQLSPSNITTLFATEVLSPNKLPTEKYNAFNIGPYTFSGWRYADESYNQHTYSYNVKATRNLAIYPNFTYNESNHLSIMKNDVYNSIVKTERTYYEKILLIPIPELTGQGSGVIYTKSGNDYYVLTCAHCVENLSEYDSYKDKIYIGSTSFDSTVVKVNQAYDLAILKFTSKNYYPCTNMAISSFPGSSFSAVGSIGSPNGNFNQIALGKYVTSTDIINAFGYKMTTVQYTNCLGHGCSGGGLYNCVGDLIGITSNGSEDNSKGYAVPIETVRKFLFS